MKSKVVSVDDNELVSFKAIFEACDLDGDQAISFKELLSMYEAIEIYEGISNHRRNQNLKQLFKIYSGEKTSKDEDPRQELTYEQFLIFCIECGLFKKDRVFGKVLLNLEFLGIEEFELKHEILSRRRELREKFKQYQEQIEAFELKNEDWKKKWIKFMEKVLERMLEPEKKSPMLQKLHSISCLIQYKLLIWEIDRATFDEDLNFVDLKTINFKKLVDDKEWVQGEPQDIYKLNEKSVK